MKNMSFQSIDILREASAKWPDRVAIHHNDQKITFQTLLLEVNKLNSSLTNVAKEQGKVIGLLSGNNTHFITGLFAASAAGYVVMPIWKNLAPLEIEKVLEQSFTNILLIEKDASHLFTRQHERTKIDDYFDLITFTDIKCESINVKFPDAIRQSSVGRE